MSAPAQEKRQLVRYAFYKLDPSWRRLPPAEQREQKAEFAAALVPFEGDDAAEFLRLVMQLRESAASRYTLRDTPTFTCIQMALRDMLDALGGASLGRADAPPARGDGFIAVAAAADVPPGTARRVYAGGDAIAVFNVGGR